MEGGHQSIIRQSIQINPQGSCYGVMNQISASPPHVLGLFHGHPLKHHRCGEGDKRQALDLNHPQEPRFVNLPLGHRVT